MRTYVIAESPSGYKRVMKPGTAKKLGWETADAFQTDYKAKKRKKATTKRKPAKKTAAQLHAFRVKQGKKLAAMRKKELKGRKPAAKRKARK